MKTRNAAPSKLCKTASVGETLHWFCPGSRVRIQDNGAQTRLDPQSPTPGVLNTRKCLAKQPVPQVA
eukprot:gene25727-biopygen18018